MKKMLALTCVMWLGSALIVHAQTPKADDDVAACFRFPKDRPVTVEGVKKARAYLKALTADPALSQALDLVCSRASAQLVKDQDSAAKAIKIDGSDADWKAVPLAIADKSGTVRVYDKEKPVGTAPTGMDLAEVSYLLTDKDLFLRFKTHGPPAKGNVSYWFQIYGPKREKIYDVILGATAVRIQLYEKGKYVRSADPVKGKHISAIKDIVEGRVSRSMLPRLPDTFDVIPVCFSDKSNHIDFAPEFTAKSSHLSAGLTPAYLLSRYAEKQELLPDDRLPLAVALTESFLYDNVEPSLRETVVADGLAMIEAGANVPNGLKDLPLEALIAWSNRSLYWGSLSSPYLKDRRITAEAYEFMCVNPRTLPEVREHLLSMGIGKQSKAADLAKVVHDWAKGKNKYRWKLDEMKEWAKTRGGDFPRLYKEALDDVRAGKDKVCTVNGEQIYFYSVYSPKRNWESYRKNGFYYGCGGDVTVMEMLAYKALGVPDIAFFWQFTVSDQHVFAGYYDREDKVWRSPQQPGDKKGKVIPVFQWSLPALSGKMPTWEKKILANGAELWLSERSPIQNLTLPEMKQKLTQGITNDEFRRRLYAQVGNAKQEVAP